MSDMMINGGIHTGRDTIITVGDRQGQSYKLIDDMTPKELRAERIQRNHLVVQAARKNEQQIIFWLKVVAVTSSILAIWIKIAGEFHTAMFYYGAMLVGIPFLSMIGSMSGDSEFIAHQEATLKKIETLLREREPFE